MTHRWFTCVLFGRWCSGPEEALYDALRSGQAVCNPDQSDEIVLRTFTGIEVREPSLGRGKCETKNPPVSERERLAP